MEVLHADVGVGHLYGIYMVAFHTIFLQELLNLFIGCSATVAASEDHITELIFDAGELRIVEKLHDDLRHAPSVTRHDEANLFVWLKRVGELSGLHGCANAAEMVVEGRLKMFCHP